MPETRSKRSAIEPKTAWSARQPPRGAEYLVGDQYTIDDIATFLWVGCVDWAHCVWKHLRDGEFPNVVALHERYKKSLRRSGEMRWLSNRCLDLYGPAVLTKAEAPDLNMRDSGRRVTE